MDFLDPRKKRAYKIRLIIGYVLVALAIGLAALVLVYNAYGYSINTKTGDVVQNSLVFVGSKPGGADVYLNGVHRSTTSARLVLPAGSYTLKLTKAGYNSWRRDIQAEASAVEYYVYPFLFPSKPVSTPVQPYDSQPPLITQSLDRHWLLVQAPATTGSSINFDEYDTTKPTQPPQAISLPENILTKANLPGSSLSVVEWSTDDNHLLLQHTYQGGTEFIILDRNNPAAAFNVNQMFSVNPTQVALRNKSSNQLYIYDQPGQTLRVGDTTKPELDPVFLKHVLAFKAYGNNLLTYVTDNNMPASQVQARIWNNGPTYPLYSFSAGNHYLIDAAQYGGHWYYIAGSDTDGRVNIFQDPLGNIKNPTVGKAVATLSLRVHGATKVSFSTNERFVEVQNGQNFGVYDFETKSRYQYTVQAPLAGPLHWMDGSRLIGASSGMVFVSDYDGTNQQSLAPTVEADGGYFSVDYNHLFSLAPVAGSGQVPLVNVDMRAGADLPKTSP